MKRAVLFWLAATAIALGIGIAAFAWWEWDGLGILGSVASVIGVIVTIQVALAVHHLKGRYVGRVMLDSSVQRLRSTQDKLWKSIRSKDLPEMQRRLGEIMALFERRRMLKFYGMTEMLQEVLPAAGT